MNSTSKGCPFSGGLMNGLKAATQDLHNKAENHEFQQKFSRGEIGKMDYVDYLGQMWHVHRTLEAAIRRQQPVVEALRLIPDDQFQQANLAQDLDFFGVDPNEIPCAPAVARWELKIDEMEQSQPVGLFGCHYVLEGSKNGSRIIARSIRSQLGLAEGRGDRYLDPYGNDQRRIWLEFRERINAVQFSPQDSAVIAQAAQETFVAITEISGDLLNLVASRKEMERIPA